MNLNNSLEDSEDFPVSLKNKNESEGFLRRTEAVHGLFFSIARSNPLKVCGLATAQKRLKAAGLMRSTKAEKEDWIVEDLIERYLEFTKVAARLAGKR